MVTSRIMAAVPSRDTRPELALRRALFAAGLRYRVAPRELPGRPDIAFPRVRLAVFVDGDFWHGNAWRLRSAASTADLHRRWRNSDFWNDKIETNVRRDRRVEAELKRLRWRVVRFWESTVVSDLDDCVRQIAAAIKS